MLFQNCPKYFDLIALSATFLFYNACGDSDESVCTCLVVSECDD